MVFNFMLYKLSYKIMGKQNANHICIIYYYIFII